MASSRAMWAHSIPIHASEAASQASSGMVCHGVVKAATMAAIAPMARRPASRRAVMGAGCGAIPSGG